MALGIHPGIVRALLSIAVALPLSPLLFPSNAAAAQIGLDTAPGPRTMTVDEKALAANPAEGSEHGVILIDETQRDDRAGKETKIFHRFRAKILSNEGRSLGDIRIAFWPNSVLEKFWAWTILPDGTVRELKKGDLHVQVLAESSAFEKVSAWMGALPGVTSGCVIEYGYQILDRGVPWRDRVELQASWPTRLLRYHWLPYGGRVASLRVARGEGLGVSMTRDSRSILLMGKDLPGVVEEPYMPPLWEVRASAMLYYRSSSDDTKDFWSQQARRESTRAAVFARDKPLQETLEKMQLPAGADLPAKLKAVYEWLATHVKLTGLRSAEEEEAAARDEDSGLFAQDVLQSGRATGRQMDYLFLGFARVLGAEGYMVLTTDRTRHFFDPALLTQSQFDWTVVALHLPGEPPDRFLFVDSGTGLPFGELPWWISGSAGFLADPKGWKNVLLQPSNPVKNYSETKASVSFHPEDGSAAIRWSRSDSGQSGLSERLKLRSSGPADRRKSLDKMCGASGRFEVSRAEAPGLDDLNRGLTLECEGTLTELDFQQDTYSFPLNGAWAAAVPELTAETRIHPIVFDFLLLDQNAIDIEAPPGFQATQPPAVPTIDSPWGHYALFISPTPGGYHVERVFSLTSPAIPANNYAPLRRFLTKVRQADRTTVEFRKTR